MLNDQETASQTYGPKSVIPDNVRDTLIDQPVPPRIIPLAKKKAAPSLRLGEHLKLPPGFSNGFRELLDSMLQEHP